MAKAKGSPKTGGRKKGVGNITPPMKSLRVGLAEAGFNLSEELVKLYLSATDDNMRLNILKLITQYTQVIPKEEAAVIPPQTDTQEAAATDTESLLKAVK